MTPTLHRWPGWVWQVHRFRGKVQIGQKEARTWSLVNGQRWWPQLVTWLWNCDAAPCQIGNLPLPAGGFFPSVVTAELQPRRAPQGRVRLKCRTAKTCTGSQKMMDLRLTTGTFQRCGSSSSQPIALGLLGCLQALAVATVDGGGYKTFC